MPSAPPKSHVNPPQASLSFFSPLPSFPHKQTHYATSPSPSERAGERLQNTPPAPPKSHVNPPQASLSFFQGSYPHITIIHPCSLRNSILSILQSCESWFRKHPASSPK